MAAGLAVSRLARVICLFGVFYAREGRLRLGGWLYGFPSSHRRVKYTENSWQNAELALTKLDLRRSIRFSQVGVLSDVTPNDQ